MKMTMTARSHEYSKNETINRWQQQWQQSACSDWQQQQQKRNWQQQKQQRQVAELATRQQQAALH